MEFTGGIRYGYNYFFSIRAGSPLAKLTIEPDSLKLSTFLMRSFRFEKDQIERLSEYSVFLSSGIQIEHSVEDYPALIVFSTFNINAVKAGLIENGYDVA